MRSGECSSCKDYRLLVRHYGPVVANRLIRLLRCVIGSISSLEQSECFAEVVRREFDIEGFHASNAERPPQAILAAFLVQGW